MKVRISLSILFALMVVITGCTKKTVRYLDKPIRARSSLAIIVNTKHKQVENLILTKFMKAGYGVKAMNHSDLYTKDGIYDIRDFKKISYRNPSGNAIKSMEKTVENIYKLHIYNFELNKAETLQEIRKAYNVDYLLLLDLKDWGRVSWGRAIDLRTLEIVWVENIRTKMTDNVESLIDHILISIKKK
jgi:hypothetical protein